MMVGVDELLKPGSDINWVAYVGEANEMSRQLYAQFNEMRYEGTLMDISKDGEVQLKLRVRTVDVFHSQDMMRMQQNCKIVIGGTIVKKD